MLFSMQFFIEISCEPLLTLIAEHADVLILTTEPDDVLTLTAEHADVLILTAEPGNVLALTAEHADVSS